MKTFSFYGHDSDRISIGTSDTIGKTVWEHDTEGEYEQLFMVESTKTGEAVFVMVQLAENGTWIVYPQLADQGDLLPDWKYRYTQIDGYSLCLLIDVPDDAEIHLAI